MAAKPVFRSGNAIRRKSVGGPDRSAGAPGRASGARDRGLSYQRPYPMPSRSPVATVQAPGRLPAMRREPAPDLIRGERPTWRALCFPGSRPHAKASMSEKLLATPTRRPPGGGRALPGAAHRAEEPAPDPCSSQGQALIRGLSGVPGERKGQEFGPSVLQTARGTGLFRFRPNLGTEHRRTIWRTLARSRPGTARSGP